jgi:histone-lysine N-methyltransferase SETMAR
LALGFITFQPLQVEKLRFHKKMEKIEVRAIIKYLCLKKLTTQEIHEDMIITLGESAPAYSTVAKWVAEFRRGRQSTEDEPRCGRPQVVATPETVERVQEIVISDRRLTLEQIAATVRISESTVRNIIVNVLGMKKISARWVPRMLTDENKRQRLDTSTELLALYKQDPSNFLARLVTQDETWVHHYSPEQKRQSMEWHHAGSPPPRKFKSTPSAGKVMASIFWDCDGIILIDYLSKGETINGNYYANLLQQLREAIKTKRRGKLGKGILLLQDNAPVHTALVAKSAARSCGFQLLPHPPYSPDLAPSDFYLFPKLKSELAGRRFETDDDVISAVETFFDYSDKSFFLTGLQMLEKRWTKCIEVEGDYVEK